jgi:hypothetical protein
MEQLYDSLNSSERFGLQFGLFPVKCKEFIKTREDSLDLMKYAKERGYK